MEDLVVGGCFSLLAASASKNRLNGTCSGPHLPMLLSLSLSLSHTHTHTHTHINTWVCQSHLFFCSLLYINLTYSCYKRMHGFICFLVLALVKGWWGHEFRVSVTIQFPFCLYWFSFSSLDLWPLRWLGRSCPGIHVILCSRINTIFLSILSKKEICRIVCSPRWASSSAMHTS